MVVTDRAAYVARVETVVDQLMSDRLLLKEDADRYLEKARAEGRVKV